MAINCDTAYPRLLEADPTELAGHGDTELAVHVRDCARCQAVGATLLAGQEQLATALTELRPATDVDQALSAMRSRRSTPRSWSWLGQWGPVAAAAVVSGIMILQSVTGSRMIESEIVLAPPTIEPFVEVSTDQKVMVFETQDESAKVLWFY
jgi:anti-sigma factor RsiW